MGISQINAFKVTYLLGADKEHLAGGFNELYNKYDSLELFKKSDLVQKVRSLCRLRQGLIRNYSFYKNCVSFPDPYKGIDEEDIAIALDNGFDLKEVFTIEANVAGVVNALTKEISKSVPSALALLGVEHPMEVAEFFYMFELDKKSGLAQFVNAVKGVNFPYQIIIARHKRIEKVLKYVLMHDKNLLLGAYTLAGGKYTGSFDFSEEDKFYSKYINNEVVVEGTSDSVIDTDTDSVVGEAEDVEVANTGVMNTSDEDTLSYATETKILQDYLQDKKDVIVYVDCDNVDFFTFLGLFTYLETCKKIKEIRLYVDDKSSYLWKNIKSIFSDSKLLTVQNVKRLKDTKSITDMIIATDICTQVFKGKNYSVMLLSSDSDYYGVMDRLDAGNKTVNYAVGYNNTYTSPCYLNKLEESNIPFFDIRVFNNTDLNKQYESACIKHLVACNLANVPPIMVDLSKTCEIVLNALEREGVTGIDKERVEEELKNIRNNISFKFSDDNTVLVTVDDITLSFDQKVQV